MSDQLSELKKRFNPRRTYNHGNVTLEVDGAFVRIDDEMNIEGDMVRIPLEDFVQDPGIIRSARVSTGRDTADVNEKAAGMIGKLDKENHVTPFESAVEFRTKVTAPIYTAQPFFQIFSAGNEFSGRYSELDGPFATPAYAEGSTLIADIFREAEYDSQTLYRTFLDQYHVAREQARFAILFRFFTKFYWKVSLRHLLDVCALEENPFAPPEFWEIRNEILLPMLRDWVPWTYEKFCENKKVVKTAWAKDLPTPELTTWIWSHDVNDIGNVRLLSAMVNEDVMQRGVHTGPDPKRGFGHSLLSFEIHEPIFVHRQWVRHRYGVWSELPVDFDAVVAKSDFYIPQTFRKQIGKPMEYQFEDMVGGENERVRDDLNRLIIRSSLRYKHLRNLGLLPRQAALVLPYVFRIPVLWSVNCESIMNFFSLRCDMHAQHEIRMFANTIYQWFADKYPWSNKIFLDHINYGSSPLLT